MRQKTARLIKSDGLQRQAGRLRTSNQMATKRFDTENFNLDELLGLTPAAGFPEQAETEQAETIEYRYKPEDYSNVGEAKVYRDQFRNKVAFTPQTGFLIYENGVWREDQLKAQKFLQELTDEQRDEARKAVARLTLAAMESADQETKRLQADAKEYYKHVEKHRQNSGINGTMAQIAPMLAVKVEDLDKDPYLLNTPGGTVDLKTGTLRPHSPLDYCTKSTTATPSANGAEKWQEFLDAITGRDKDLQKFMQMCVGMAVIGEVKEETIIILYGFGGNGKSTFDMAVFYVLGDYATMLSSEVIAPNRNNGNGKAELAELRGKRFALASELGESARLDTSVLKKIASTVAIKGEKKFKDPFDFRPTHTVLLETNHLPSVKATDTGTWDRLKVIPFNQHFRNENGEKKNYAKELSEECGGAILQWIVDGAKLFIENNYTLTKPEAVKKATEEYRENEDSVNSFLKEGCRTGNDAKVTPNNFYTAYKIYCRQAGIEHVDPHEFRQILLTKGLKSKSSNGKRWYRGICPVNPITVTGSDA